MIVVFQSPSCVWLFATPWTAAFHASLSFTISWNLLRFMSIESAMPSNHLILCRPLFLLPSVFPSIRIFSNELPFASGGQSIEVSASASVLPMNIQCWFPLGLTSLTSFLSKGFPRIFFSTTIQKHQFFSVQPSLWSNSHSVSEYLFRSIHDFCGIRRILFLFTTSPWNSWIYILVGGYPSSSNIQ